MDFESEEDRIRNQLLVYGNDVTFKNKPLLIRNGSEKESDLSVRCWREMHWKALTMLDTKSEIILGYVSTI